MIWNDMRITFDQDITYINVRHPSKRKSVDNECVMEIKIPMTYNLQTLAELVQLPDSRFSKYCRGIERTVNNKVR